MDFDFSTETITPDNTTLLTIGGTGAIEVPSGTTANRPVTGLANGALRYNADVTALEAYVGAGWATLSTGGTAVSTFSGGTTGLTPNSATSGAVTLAGTLVPANGGTGITTTPLSGQLLIGNGTNYTVATLGTGTGISITAGTGTLQVNNTGVTSNVAGTNITVSGATGAVSIATSATPSFTTITSTQATGTAPFTVASTTNVANLNASSLNGATFAAPGTIGGGTAGSGAFTTLSASGVITSTQATGTAPFTVASTTNVANLNASSLSGATFAAPGAIGGGTAGAITGTTITANTGFTGTLTGHASLDLALTGGTMTGDLVLYGSAPATSASAVPKSYVDSVITGLTWKQAVRAASIAALTVTYSNGTAGVGATLTNANTQAAFAIDGYTAALNDRILIKNQTSTLQNGIYTVTTLGSGATNWVLTRAVDSNTPALIDGEAVFVTLGSTMNDTGWTETATVTAVGTDAVVYAQFSGAGAYAAGTGLSLTGNTFANTGVLSLTTSSGLSTNTTATGAVSITNTGVTSNVAGTGITVSGATGAVTITNSGVTSAVAGTNITVSGATGAVTIATSATPSFTTITSTQTTGTAPFTVASTTNVANLNASSLNGATFAAPGAIGGGTAAAGTFVALTATGVISYATTTNNQTYSTTGAGVISISSGTAGTINNMSIGATTAGTGRFTSVTATGLTANSFLYSGTGGLLTTTTAPTNGQLLIGSTGSTPVAAALTQGTGITVTNAAGSITIANSGVTSVGGTGTVSGLTLTGTVTTTGNLTLGGTLAVTASNFASQTANTVLAAPNGSAGTPTFRTLAYADLPVKLYVENPSTPTTPLAAGTNAVATGSGTSASATSSQASGLQSIARVYGERALSSGQFATLGDAQHGEYNLRISTANATPTEAFLDGASARLVLPNNSAYMFVADIVCRRTDATGTVGAWTVSGLISRDATAATTAISGAVSKTTIAKTTSTMDVALTADTTNGSLNVNVTGVAAQTVRWSIYIRTQEVTN